MAEESPQRDGPPAEETASAAASADADASTAAPAASSAPSESMASESMASESAASEGAAPNDAQPAPAAAEGAPPRPAKRREMTGVVLSSKADKTISVRIDRRVKHPVYSKIVRRSSKLAAHDERNECRAGDVVTIVETRPVSKTKSWRLGRIVERAGA